jgi:hypothetical protein
MLGYDLSMLEGKQKIISALLMVGAGLFLLGFLGTVTLCMSGPLVLFGLEDESLVALRLGPLLIGLGTLIVLGTLLFGLWLNQHRHEGPMKVYPGARVVAKFVINRDGDPVISDYDLYEGLRYFVQLDIGQRKVVEFECAPETFWGVGDGLWGEAHCQGNWLGQFKPVPYSAELP